jgi:hypothetical protein
MANIRFGTLTLRIDGQQYLVTGAFSANLGTDKREAQVGIDGHVGTKVTPRSPWIKGTMRDWDGLDLKRLLNMVDVTVTAELANGKAYAFRGAFQTGEGDVNIDEGTVDVMFNATSAEEI